MTRCLAGDNKLEVNRFEYPLPPQVFLSDNEEKATSGSGSVSTYSTIAMFAVSIIIIGIQ